MSIRLGYVLVACWLMAAIDDWRLLIVDWRCSATLLGNSGCFLVSRFSCSVPERTRSLVAWLLATVRRRRRQFAFASLHLRAAPSCRRPLPFPLRCQRWLRVWLIPAWALLSQMCACVCVCLRLLVSVHIVYQSCCCLSASLPLSLSLALCAHWLDFSRCSSQFQLPRTLPPRSDAQRIYLARDSDWAKASAADPRPPSLSRLCQRRTVGQQIDLPWFNQKLPFH